MNIKDQQRKEQKAINKARQGQVYTKDTQGNIVFEYFGNMEIDNGITMKQFMKDVYEAQAYNKDVLLKLYEELQGAQFVHPDKQYVCVGIKDGYICEGYTHVAELTVPIEELYKGYCVIIEDGYAKKIVIDEQQKQRYLKTFEGGKVL